MFGHVSEAQLRQIIWNLLHNWQRKGHVVGMRSYSAMGRLPVRVNVGIVR